MGFLLYDPLKMLLATYRKHYFRHGPRIKFRAAQNLNRVPYYEISMCFYEVEKIGHPTHFVLPYPLKKPVTIGPRAPVARDHMCTWTPP